jgi:hypothetical protein
MADIPSLFLSWRSQIGGNTHSQSTLRQEQLLRMAMAVSNFSGAEADELRVP